MTFPFAGPTGAHVGATGTGEYCPPMKTGWAELRMGHRALVNLNPLALSTTSGSSFGESMGS
jgi:hypothetical protein